MEKSIEEVIVVTTNEIEGYVVEETLGEVFGLIVRSRNIFSNVGASFRTIFGGEVRGYTNLLSDSRLHALQRLREAAVAKGANAVLAMRFDSGDIGGIMNEVAAYGTAVRVVSVQEKQRQYEHEHPEEFFNGEWIGKPKPGSAGKREEE